ncbi:MAG: Gfo/Idh/MocA family oxidoreductase [Bryobacteraceae bacterium]|nr:Gfo/Idh/MocA family oxidoreductase [Bryobacteraceae bacterium]
MNRRELLKGTGLVAAAASQPGTSAANDRIGVGIIGCGNMGGWDQRDFQSNPDVEIVALCDVYRPNLEAALRMAGGKAETYRDYRRLLEDKRVDAVVIATPEHWHAIMCIDACDAGKDVYVEKPASHNIREGRLMVEAARRNNRIVQVGMQQRSGTHFQRAVRYVQDGRLGAVHYVVCWNHSPLAMGRGEAPPPAAAPPADLDYDLWLGPAPKLPYAEVWNRGRRVLWDFSGGMLTEWGAHLTDIALWGMNARAPRSVVAAGGLFHNKEGEIPDTLQALYQFDGFLLQYSVLHHNSFGPNGDPGAARFGSYGIQFHGTKGTLFVDRAGFRLTPQMKRLEESAHPARPVMWVNDERQLGYYYATDFLPEQSDSSAQHGPHVRNFLDCVKSRRPPNADIEDGHIANTVCRLGNIAYRLERRIRWDADREQAIDDPEANRLAAGAYRAPWIPKGL